MKRSQRTLIRVSVVAAAMAIITACGTIGEKGAPDEPLSHGSGGTPFDVTVKPLFEHRCIWCHSNEKNSAGLNFQDRSTVLSPSLRFIVPGDPDASRIYRSITLESAHPGVMPGDGWGLTKAQENGLKDWINAGAPWPSGNRGEIRKKPVRIEHDDYR
jgi:hypothetical protein